ncbi:class I SAM-dependent methyltransferase [uncultured Sphingomonas sp.]|uniref:class I SAM-dependent methyltransferase n=1 Tax=uncultured Sphingomonas sp. TaxID=158754 RepID=UPI0035CA1DEB
MTDVPARAPLGAFLARNPFPHGFTDGLFYREKMRAIHRVSPARIGDGKRLRILEIGGGRSGMAGMLYPDAEIVNLDIDPALADDAANRDITFVVGDARDLPFPDDSFDVVTLLDVLEHIQDDQIAAREAARVARPGGTILVSCPDADWRYPHHGFMRAVARDEAELMAEWGHVRRGYTPDAVAALFGRPADRRAAFIGPLAAIYHDLAFSRLGRLGRTIGYAATAPLALVGYLTDRGAGKGSETAYAWDV